MFKRTELSEIPETSEIRQNRMFEECPFPSCRIVCQVIPMGKDYTVTVCGGELPHVGSVVFAQARPSLTGEGISVTSSVINGIGHKDEAVARKYAEAFAVRGNCTAVCSCGIYVDHITANQLKLIGESCERLLEQCMEDM